MPQLERTQGGGYRARKRIPNDVRADYRRLYGQGHEVKLTIPPGVTNDDAKRRYGEWLSEHAQRVAAIRMALRGEGIDLSHRQALALAGEWYKWFVARHEDAPGTPERWDTALRTLIDALEEHAPDGVRERPWTDLEWTRDPDVRSGIRPALADLGHTAQFLASQGVVLTNEAQVQFLDGVLNNYIDALVLLERRAKGDYGPDDLPSEFPEFDLRNSRRASGVSFQELFRKWIEAKHPAQSTIESWSVVFNALTRQFKDASPGAITPTDAQEWIDSLVTAERSAFTVRNTWVRAAKAVFGWGLRRNLLSRNPFVDVTIDVPRKKHRRETKAFDQNELQVILKAAAAIIDTTKPDDAAKRWVPWLLAYTGARPSEITQLRGQDVQSDDGIWSVNLTPDAGSIKTGQARRVPLHDDLCEQGFLTFVKTKGDGPLFYRLRRDTQPTGEGTKPTKPPAAQVRQRLAAWVRSLGITDVELSPNHAWRHTFKQIGTRSGLSEKVLDNICGHSPATEGRGYGAATLRDKAELLARFPRYTLDDMSIT